MFSSLQIKQIYIEALKPKRRRINQSLTKVLNKVLIHPFCAYTIYTHITHRCWGVLLRENSNHKSWELEIVIPTYLYTFACEFSSTPTSPFSYPWEVDSPNTYHTLSECQMWIWYCKEELEEARFWRMQTSGLRDPERWKRHGSKKPCWSRSLEGLGTSGRLSLESLLLTHVSQLII